MVTPQQDLTDFPDPLDLISSNDNNEAAPDPEAMLGMLSSGSGHHKMIGARAFCEIQDSRAMPLLLGLLEESCALIRVSATYALGKNPSIDAIGPLVKLYHQDLNGYVRKGVVWALGNIADRGGVPTLIHALKTDISSVRLWAASGLAQHTELEYEDVTKAIAPLIQGLRTDPIPAVRSNCAWAMGRLCRELPSNVVYATAIDSLIEALVEDEDLGVKEDARNALLKVGDPRGMNLIEELEMDGLI
ncbi:MAG: HEAT repeat domain-containing protein [Synechococcaceae cyanobacterium RL_1_2]|nr:HEAT repeat domain-containing protein [Synechococcaceae cyanobacterium RL_1_2]